MKPKLSNSIMPASIALIVMLAPTSPGAVLMHITFNSETGSSFAEAV